MLGFPLGFQPPRTLTPQPAALWTPAAAGGGVETATHHPQATVVSSLISVPRSSNPRLLPPLAVTVTPFDASEPKVG